MLFQEKEQAEKKKAAAAAVPGQMRTASSGEEDEYLVEQVALCKIKQASLRSNGAS